MKGREKYSKKLIQGIMIADDDGQWACSNRRLANPWESNVRNFLFGIYTTECVRVCTWPDLVIFIFIKPSNMCACAFQSLI